MILTCDKSGPRNFVRMFMPQFAPLVESGAKLQTVRPIAKRMPRPGDTISLRCWTEKPYRSKQRILREATVTSVTLIRIEPTALIIENRHALEPAEADAFARADGFEDFNRMIEWFTATHGLPFVGILIQWENQ